jgi:hypothetical protein
LERVSLKSVPISTVVILIYLCDGQIIAQKHRDDYEQAYERALFSPHFGAYVSQKSMGRTIIARFMF